MRFWQVKQSINEEQLLEAKEGLESQHTIHDIQAISNAIPQVPEEEAGAKQKLINQLKQAETILKDFIKKAKLGEFSKEKPTTEAIETEATDGVKRKLLNINKSRMLGWKFKENFDYELKKHINKENFSEKNFT